VIARQRLRHQLLTGSPSPDATSLVARQGAVQAQDYGGALWALAMRLPPSTTEVELDALFARGDILRTHVLRPTWHFVTPRDIRWMLRLTGPRILSSSKGRLSQLALDAVALLRAQRALRSALEGGRQLGREELRAVLRRARVPADDSERFAWIMLVAELEGLVTSGARRGKQFTHALLDERAPDPGLALEGRDAVRELVRRYFASHGPATPHDFATWSGLTIGDARRELADLADEFTAEEADGFTWWRPEGTPPRAARSPVARLLPNYDEHFIGFRDRQPLLARLDRHGARPDPRALLAHVMTVDGEVVGSWRRTAEARGVDVALVPRVPLTDAERAAFDREVARLGRFLGLDARSDWRH
jgi:hypothetical protein